MIKVAIPTGDPAGRLADFARFAVEEIGELLPALTAERLGSMQRRAAYHAEEAQTQLDEIASLLCGFTTADDD